MTGFQPFMHVHDVTKFDPNGDGNSTEEERKLFAKLDVSKNGALDKDDFAPRWSSTTDPDLIQEHFDAILEFQEYGIAAIDAANAEIRHVKEGNAFRPTHFYGAATTAWTVFYLIQGFAHPGAFDAIRTPRRASVQLQSQDKLISLTELFSQQTDLARKKGMLAKIRRDMLSSLVNEYYENQETIEAFAPETEEEKARQRAYEEVSAKRKRQCVPQNALNTKRCKADTALEEPIANASVADLACDGSHLQNAKLKAFCDALQVKQR